MKFRRRTYLIDSGFQMRIISIFMIVSFIGSLAAVIIFNFLALKELETLMWSIHIKVKSTGELFKPLFINTNVASSLFISLLLIITALWMMRKAAGPVYRMSKDIIKAADGDLTVEVVLRNKDEFKDTALELNSMLKELRRRFRSISDNYLQLSGSLNSLYAQDNKADNCVSALAHIKRLELELANFRLSKQ